LIKKWHDECVLFLDDCFSNDRAVAKLSRHFTVETFPKWFRTESNKKKQGVKDPSVIEFCNEKKWLLVTTDHEMRKTHAQEIRVNPCFTAIATANNSATAQEYEEWLDAIIKLKPRILRYYKKNQRPWFATFSRDARITTFTDEWGESSDTDHGSSDDEKDVTCEHEAPTGTTD
jgi:hypothetical protein